MKKIILSVLLGLGVLNLAAAEGQWLTDFDQAKDRAKKENKVVLLDFTGSDWCPPCIKLKNEVFSTKEFEEFASKNLVLVEVDFPSKKKLPAKQKQANEKLQKEFDIEAFPTIVLLDSSGKKLGQFEGYGGDSASAYIKKLQRLMATKSS